MSQLKRVRECGHKIGGPEAGPTLGVITNRDGTRSAAYGGLKHCGSVWTCPVCAVKVAARRADDLAAVMRAVYERGGSAFMLTLTMRHAAVTVLASRPLIAAVGTARGTPRQS